jgi:hypothetical protein
MNSQLIATECLGCKNVFHLPPRYNERTEGVFFCEQCSELGHFHILSFRAPTEAEAYSLYYELWCVLRAADMRVSSNRIVPGKKGYYGYVWLFDGVLPELVQLLGSFDYQYRLADMTKSNFASLEYRPGEDAAPHGIFYRWTCEQEG